MTTTVVATGTSSTDTAALQAAIDAESGGGEVVVDGMLRLEKAQANHCVDMKDNVVVRALGNRHGDGVKLADGLTDGAGWLRMMSAVNLTRIVLRGIVVDGNRANLGALANTEQHHGVFLSGTTDVDSEDCVFKNCQGDGIYFYRGCRRGKVRGNDFDNCHRVGINVTHLSDGIVSGNRVRGATGTPAWSSESGIKVEMDPTDSGWLAGHLVISDNFVQAQSGIAVSGNAANLVPNVLIIGNVIRARDDNDRGVAITGGWAPGLNIVSNTVEGFDDAVLLSGGCTDTAVHNNVLIGAGGAQGDFDGGIKAGGTTIAAINERVSICGNIISNMGRGIVILYQTGVVGSREPSDFVIANNVVSALDDEAIVIMDGQRFTITGNIFKTATSQQAGWMRRVGFDHSDIVIFGNQFDGGSIRNLLLQSTPKDFSLGMNLFRNSGTKVSGLDRSGQFQREPNLGAGHYA